MKLPEPTDDLPNGVRPLLASLGGRSMVDLFERALAKAGDSPTFARRLRALASKLPAHVGAGWLTFGATAELAGRAADCAGELGPDGAALLVVVAALAVPEPGSIALELPGGEYGFNTVALRKSISSTAAGLLVAHGGALGQGARELLEALEVADPAARVPAEVRAGLRRALAGESPPPAPRAAEPAPERVVGAVSLEDLPERLRLTRGTDKRALAALMKEPGAYVIGLDHRAIGRIKKRLGPLGWTIDTGQEAGDGKGYRLRSVPARKPAR